MPEKSTFPVNIEKINGKDPGPNVKHWVRPGSHSLEVSLVFSADDGVGMTPTQNRIYTKDVRLDVEAGKTYVLAAKVDTRASKKAQEEGTFWDPIVYAIK